MHYKNKDLLVKNNKNILFFCKNTFLKAFLQNIFLYGFLLCQSFFMM